MNDLECRLQSGPDAQDSASIASQEDPLIQAILAYDRYDEWTIHANRTALTVARAQDRDYMIPIAVKRQWVVRETRDGKAYPVLQDDDPDRMLYTGDLINAIVVPPPREGMDWRVFQYMPRLLGLVHGDRYAHYDVPSFPFLKRKLVYRLEIGRIDPNPKGGIPLFHARPLMIVDWHDATHVHYLSRSSVRLPLRDGATSWQRKGNR